MRWLALLLLVLACSGASVDPLEDGGSDASEDHKLGTSGDSGDASDASSGAALSGDSGPVTACYRDYDASAPPFDCTKEHDTQNNPLPYKFVCPFDAGADPSPSGTNGVTCIEEAFIGTSASVWCCGN